MAKPSKFNTWKTEATQEDLSVLTQINLSDKISHKIRSINNLSQENEKLKFNNEINF